MNSLGQISIRLADASEADKVAAVMYHSIRFGDSPYTEEQRVAWCATPRTGDEWVTRLRKQTVYVAAKSNRLIGVMTLRPDGYIDLAYIRPNCRGKGLFRALYQNIESTAHSNGIKKLWVHASMLAQPAFSAVGFTTTVTELVELAGQQLKRFAMEKAL